MTRIKDGYWIETDNFTDSSIITKHLQTEEIKETKYPNVKTPQSTVDNRSLSRFEIYPTAQTICGKPEPLFSQYEDIFVTYLDGFHMNTGQPKPHSKIDQNMSGKIQFDNSIKKYIFPALNISNNFATIDYDAHINTKIDFTINHVFISMTVQELNTLHTVCELERTQLLTILAMSVKNPQLAGFLLTGNRKNFLYVEGSTAWLYDCPHFISPLYNADKCFDRIPIHYRETIMYVDPITRETFNYATPIECGNIPQSIIELDPDSDDGDLYVLTPDPLKREPPQTFKPTQTKTTITPNRFTAQDAGIYSNAELDQFWDRVLFAKISDTTLQLLGESLSYDFITMHNEHHFHTGSNPYNHLRIGLHDRLLNLLPLFNPNWFSLAFINLFGYPCYILTQCGVYFSAQQLHLERFFAPSKLRNYRSLYSGNRCHCDCWRQSSESRESRFGTCWLRNKNLTLRNLDENLKKILTLQTFKPPKWVFSKSLSQRAMKLGTHTQIANTNSPAKFQGHSPIITSFTLHMCGIQGH